MTTQDGDAGVRAGLSRRSLLQGGAATLGLAAILPDGVSRRAHAAVDAASARDLLFDVSRDDAPIGRHEIRFDRTGGRLEVDIRIELEIGLLFVTAFRYSHRNRETWQDGRLAVISTRTDDDGTDHRLQGRQTADGLVIETGGGREVVPAGLLPTSWWHPATMGRSQLLNTQDGRIMSVRMTAGAEERIPGDGGTIPARRHVCRGDVDLELWRDRADRLARIRFTAPRDGSVIDYRRRPGG